MDGRRIEDGLTPEQLAEAQRHFEVMKKATEADLWRIACLMAGKADDQLLGRTEFEVRDQAMRIGAEARHRRREKNLQLRQPTLPFTSEETVA